MKQSVDSTMATSTRDSITEKELTECNRERLDYIARIQGGAGHLLFIEYPSGRILAHDRDIRKVPWIKEGNETSADLPKLVEESLIDSDIASFCPEDFYEALFSDLGNLSVASSPRTFRFYSHKDKAYDISVSSTASDYSIVGIEIEEINSDQAAVQHSLTLTYLGRMVAESGHGNIAKTACDTVFKIIGNKFDRGMVYKFHDDLSGEVIHEIKSECTESSYLGLRFPMSDIPLSARKLYIANGMRYIEDVDAEDVPVVSKQGVMDLTHIRMRAVAKPHIIYLRNMGVKCSMSLAIIVDNELWGLLAFHGYNHTYKPSLHQRIACETISTIMSVRIEATIKKAQSQRIVKLGESMMSLKPDRGVIHNLFDRGEGLLEIVGADTLVGYVQDAREGDGDNIALGDKSLVPSDTFWARMVMHPDRELCIISNREGITALGLSEEDCPAAGIVYFRQGRTHIMLGRSTRSKDVKWAGYPDTPKLSVGGILNPRSSFNTFIEKARTESRAWSTEDINVISVLRDRICENAHTCMLALLRGDMEKTNGRYLTAMERARDNFEFFARMSHELRTPFHGVMGCLAILQESDGKINTAEAKDVVNTAITSGNHMIRLLNEILDISKNQHLLHTSVRDHVIYQSLAFDTIDCMRSLASSRQIQLESSIEPKDDKVVVSIDRTKVIQIVTNIVNNAIKFTSEGNIAVNFRLVDSREDAVLPWMTSSTDHAGAVFSMREGEMLTTKESVAEQVAEFPSSPDQRWISISVVDSGCGMEPKELADMFSPYTQSSKGSSRAFKGTGLGLYICVSLCRQLSGFIACASTPDRGTTFHVGLPVELPKQGDTTTSDDSTYESSLLGEDILMRGPILIVDDNTVNVKILHRALQIDLRKANVEIDIHTTFGGKEAVQLYKEHHPSLCIIDYHMPATDGLAATKIIRQYENKNNLPPSCIVIYTADVTDETGKLILNSGANENMAKPPPKGSIKQLVQRLVLVDRTQHNVIS